MNWRDIPYKFFPTQQQLQKKPYYFHMVCKQHFLGYPCMFRLDTRHIHNPVVHHLQNTIYNNQ
jgi:hypothetical protein